MNVMVNGDRWEMEDGATVADVIAAVTPVTAGVAVAVNGAVVPRAQWSATAVREADLIEILTAVQGG